MIRPDILSRAAVCLVALMFGLSYSLSAALIALDLAKMGLSEGWIGANVAMHAVGVLITATFLPKLVVKTGIRRLVIFALLLAAGLLVAFPALPFLWLWFPLRILLGMASEILFVLSETWTNSLSTEETRAQSMAVYTAALSVGFALGPVILSVLGPDGGIAFWAGAAIILAAAALIAWPGLEVPQFDKPAPGSPLRFMAMAPVAIAAVTLNAAVETTGLSFLSLYAIALGWAEGEAARLMAVMMIGAILLQLPIGWIGDRVNRTGFVLILAAAASAGALLWPLVLGNEWATYTLLFVWGGVFVGIYTMMLTIVGSRFAGAELVGIYAAMGLVWGVGALLGPVLAGVAMEATRHGLAYYIAALCGGFALFAATKQRKS